MAGACPTAPRGGGTFLDNINPDSLVYLTNCKLDLSQANAAPGRPIFNRTVPLRDTWAKLEKKAAPS